MSLDPREILQVIPEKPGVYQFMDSAGNMLYVGKAKNLKKRVRSYFNKNQSAKTRIMLNKAEKLLHMVTENESDALLLENNLIKKHQPRYNILLKDDKTFPWICIKNENFPRVFSTRNTIRDGSEYFGPYTSGQMVKTLTGLIRQIYRIRTCNLRLTATNIEQKKFRVCLEYHLGNCKAPCIGLQREDDYLMNIKQIREILKGNISNVIEHLKKLMSEYSTDMRFEEAQVIKEKLDILSRFRARSTVVSTGIKNADVFAVTQDMNTTYVSFLKIIDGAVIQAFTLEMKSRMDEEKESLLGFAVTEIRQRLNSDSKEIILPFMPDIQMDNIKYTVPSRGDKLRLLQLAERNALYFKLEKKKKTETTPPKDRKTKNLVRLKEDLHLADIPLHIECFDNSNLMGKNPVAACVVFRNGLPSKKEYRHFNIKTVKGPDDFSSIEEIVYRRYKRMTEEKQNLPQLVIIDGGKGQLSSAVKSLKKLHLHENIAVIGIAKKLEEIYFPGDSVPLYLDKNSISLKIIQQLRNEAHRFGIDFHRDKRSSDFTKNEMDQIKGIGEKTQEILMKKIGSVEKIRKTSYEDLEKLIGKKKASIISDFFRN